MRARGALRRGAMIGGTVIAALGFWSVNALRLDLNGSASLPDNAFIMWTWPRTLWRGLVIAAEPPEIYRDRFRGVYFTKKLIGLPGDEITHEGDAVCIAGACFRAAIRNGAPFAPLLAEGVIPEGHYAAFGVTEDSLDSRYAVVGLFRGEDIRAVGLGTNIIPNWKELKAWAEGHGY